MDTSKLVLEYIQALIWPSVVISVVYKFGNEIKALFSKALNSHEVEVDILGQRIKLTALENLTDNVRQGDDVQDKMLISGKHQPYNNSLLTLQLLNKISRLSNDEAYLLRNIAIENPINGYAGCEAERLVLESLVDKGILIRDKKDFYHPTDDGQRILLALKTSNH